MSRYVDITVSHRHPIPILQIIQLRMQRLLGRQKTFHFRTIVKCTDLYIPPKAFRSNKGTMFFHGTRGRTAHSQEYFKFAPVNHLVNVTYKQNESERKLFSNRGSKNATFFKYCVSLSNSPNWVCVWYGISSKSLLAHGVLTNPEPVASKFLGAMHMLRGTRFPRIGCQDGLRILPDERLLLFRLSRESRSVCCSVFPYRCHDANPDRGNFVRRYEFLV